MKLRSLRNAVTASVVPRLLLIVIAGGVAYYFMEKGKERRERDRQQLEELQQFKRKMNDDMKRDLDSTGSISVETSTKALDKIQKKLDGMAAGGGADAKGMKAISEVIGELQRKAAPYLEATKSMDTSNPADMRTVKDKSDLATRRQFATDLMKMNADLMAFMNSAESHVREKLNAAGVSGADKEQLVQGFTKGFGKSLPAQRRVRQADADMCKTLIAMCDLLEAEWGKWSAENGNLTFTSDATLTRYNALVETLQKAAEDQSAAQRELVTLQMQK
jgi:hypothetical protein